MTHKHIIIREIAINSLHFWYEFVDYNLHFQYEFVD